MDILPDAQLLQYNSGCQTSFAACVLSILTAWSLPLYLFGPILLAMSLAWALHSEPCPTLLVAVLSKQP